MRVGLQTLHNIQFCDHILFILSTGTCLNPIKEWKLLVNKGACFAWFLLDVIPCNHYILVFWKLALLKGRKRGVLRLCYCCRLSLMSCFPSLSWYWSSNITTHWCFTRKAKSMHWCVSIQTKTRKAKLPDGMVQRSTKKMIISPSMLNIT